jgi:FMN phosphatase YigB (HAD superfamily)
MTNLRAVVFDWRGTLVAAPTYEQWVGTALRSLDRDDDRRTVADIISRIVAADGKPSRLDAPGVDCAAARHRAAFYAVFADAGLDADLADALYSVEADPANNHFALDAATTLLSLASRGVSIAVLSDIHFDIRPSFTTLGVAHTIDAFVLSFEHGVQKPDPAIFALALKSLDTSAEQTLMVGDRQIPDGGALDVGMPTLLLPPLTNIHQRRLHHVTAIFGASAPG